MKASKKSKSAKPAKPSAMDKLRRSLGMPPAVIYLPRVFFMGASA